MVDSPHLIHRKHPNPALTNTPTTTAIFLLRLQIPSSRHAHHRQPTGQKNPITDPHSKSSSAPAWPSSSIAGTRPVPSVLELSSHWSSSSRRVVGDGIVS